MSKHDKVLERLQKHIKAIRVRGYKPRPAYQFVSHIELKRLQRW